MPASSSESPRPPHPEKPLPDRSRPDTPSASAPSASAPSASAPGHLKRLRGMARVLDSLVRIPGTRFRVGIDPLLGLLPGGGDAATGAVSAYAIVVAQRHGAPPAVLGRMVMNVILDTLVGAVPFLGDLFDLGFKANVKNVALVEQYAADPQPVKRSSRWVMIGLLMLLALLVIGLAVTTVWLLGLIADGLNALAGIA